MKEPQKNNKKDIEIEMPRLSDEIKKMNGRSGRRLAQSLEKLQQIISGNVDAIEEVLHRGSDSSSS